MTTHPAGGAVSPSVGPLGETATLVQIDRAKAVVAEILATCDIGDGWVILDLTTAVSSLSRASGRIRAVRGSS